MTRSSITILISLLSTWYNHISYILHLPLELRNVANNKRQRGSSSSSIDTYTARRRFYRIAVGDGDTIVGI